MKTIQTVALWVATLIGLVMAIIGFSGLVNVGLRTYIFTKADQNCYYAPELVKTGRLTQDIVCENQNEAQRQRDAVNGIALLITGLPVGVFFYKKTK